MQPRNPYLCLAIVVTLGVACLMGVGGIIGLAATGRAAPESLVSITGGCVGALSSFLVAVPRGSAGGDSPKSQP